MPRNKRNIKTRDSQKNGCPKQDSSENKNQRKNEYENETIEEKSIEKNKYILELINMWINNVDNKINIAFAMLSAFVAVVVFVSDNLLSAMTIDQNANMCYLDWFYRASFISAVCFCFSVFCYINAIIPRLTSDKSFLKKAQKEKELKYSIFYNEIKDFDTADDFVKCAHKANDSMFNKELLKEIYYNSGICSKKMFWFWIGAWSLFVTVVFAMLSAVLYFLYAIGAPFFTQSAEIQSELFFSLSSIRSP